MKQTNPLESFSGNKLRILKAISEIRRPLGMVAGIISSIKGCAIKTVLPGSRIGDLVSIGHGRSKCFGEVVGFDESSCTVLLYGETFGLSVGDHVYSLEKPLSINCGDFLLGRVIDGLGRPIDGRPLPRFSGKIIPVNGGTPSPLERIPISEPFETGIKTIDGFMTLGKGQRIGLFAGSGVGKSTLLGQISRRAKSDVNVVCLSGERGREAGEFLEKCLGHEGLKRSIVICSTSDRPPLERVKSVMTASTIAEYFREQGMDVLLMVDSITRVARAQREVGLAAGEPPVRQGYPPSVFRMLPEILERSGNSARGTMTAIYSVLVAGGDMDEPIADEVRGILDGHVVLSRELARNNHYPAIDVTAGISRLMPSVVSKEHLASAGRIRKLMGHYESNRDLIMIGAYKSGADPLLDEAVKLHEKIERFLVQESGDICPMNETVNVLDSLAGGVTSLSSNPP